MNLLRIAAVAALTAFGGICSGTGNAAPAGLPVDASAVRTLATPAPGTLIEKTYYYRRHYWRHRHYWRRYHHWHPYYHRHYRHHYWHPYRHYYYRRHYWHPYYHRYYYPYWHPYYW